MEYGFLDSKGDDVSQLKNNAENLANAVVKAVTEYIGLEENEDYYTVQKGDSLWSIAKKFGTSVDELKSLNNLTSNALSIGQQLIVSSLEPDTDETNTYIVRPGDTLYSIANKYGISVDQLINENNLTSPSLSIGQILVIPDGTTGIDDYIIYTVKAGDNLYAIARNYNNTVEDLMKYNNLTSNLLSIGQQIRIPLSSTSNQYAVKPGDTLYSIARQYNTTVDNIKKKNNLVSNTLSIGQILVI